MRGAGVPVVVSGPGDTLGYARVSQPSRHASESYSLALVVDQKDYDEHRGLRPV